MLDEVEKDEYGYMKTHIVTVPDYEKLGKMYFDLVKYLNPDQYKVFLKKVLKEDIKGSDSARVSNDKSELTFNKVDVSKSALVEKFAKELQTKNDRIKSLESEIKILKGSCLKAPDEYHYEFSKDNVERIAEALAPFLEIIQEKRR